MGPHKKADLPPDEKVKPVKRARGKARKNIPVKFDKEGFLLAWGLGIVTSGMGVFLIWATKTAPIGAAWSRLTGYSVSHRLVQLLPQSTKESIAMILGVLFVLFGIVCLFFGVKLIVQHLMAKARN